MPDLPPLYPVRRHHLESLTDDVGIMQHAIGARPDPGHGYCTDDVARALQVDLLHARELGWEAVAASAWRSFRFLAEAIDEPAGRFRNFRLIDGSWVDAVGSEDSHGRGVHALGDVIAEAPDGRMADAAAELFSRALPAAGLTALRAQASVLLGCAGALEGRPSRATESALRLMATRFREGFTSRAASDWPWPESRLTYENALPARALIVAGGALGSQRMTELGLRVLGWLIDIQVAPEGHLSPIGNGWWPQFGERSRFDQQPIEATALLLAAESAFKATADEQYRTAMERAYAWFLGRNDLGLQIADPGRGAGCDGLTPRGVNSNQGAESTLMWLTAAEHIRALRAGPPAGERRAGQALATSISIA